MGPNSNGGNRPNGQCCSNTHWNFIAINAFGNDKLTRIVWTCRPAHAETMVVVHFQYMLAGWGRPQLIS